ncbi:dermonecrotic toxin domain-containing protein [Pseudomonas fulva]|uniref:dermonecrotic toxin domain-containing protein n=1 Tax=Pseudomonas fulva TaxID=47880 RepID=UPI002DB9D780|nr:DUF6543 domain-containing protein [Pseudomonas fulva]MEB8056592.1 hypothetical protein [Pseudomonas fulva]
MPSVSPLQHFESFDAAITALLSPLPSPDLQLPPVAGRQQFFGALADYWNLPDATGNNRRTRLIALRRQQLQAEMDLRITDATLEPVAASLLQTCLDQPMSWARQGIEASRRPQLYRLLLDCSRPNWRAYLPGAVLLVQGGVEGQMMTGDAVSGPALLCSLSHGIEAFADVQSLHLELCERLDDPLQSQPMLTLLAPADADRAHNAQRLRYDWLPDDLVEVQIQALIDAQHGRLNEAWSSQPMDQPGFAERLTKAADLLPWVTSKAAMPTRYGLLLEKHAPAWLKKTSTQGLTHIMQTMQELIVAIDQAAAPGIPTLEQFTERNSLLQWTRARLSERLRLDHQLDLAPEQIFISVTIARQTGPVMPPGQPSSYIPIASRPQTGNTVELVRQTYSLDQLALLNVGLLDLDYWLTARVHHRDETNIQGLSPAQARQMVRELNVGDSYSRFLRSHLIDLAQGQWRRDAHARINCARMRAEAAKARYAGHFIPDPLEQGYRWSRAVLNYPDSDWRPLVQENRLSVRQLLIAGHTVQGVLLITPETPQMQRFLVYAPDAPDRRPWREYANARALLRSLRASPDLRTYVIDRMPLARRKTVERLLSKGGLAQRLSRPVISGNFLHACYLAEVRAFISAVDASTNTKQELLGEASLHALWIMLDLISFVIPVRALTPLAFARAVLSVLDSLEALEKEDQVGVLKHMVEAFTHMNDGINSIGGTTVIRRAIRAMPPTPPLMLPPTFQVRPDTAKLRYRIDGIHSEGVYEKPSERAGLALYYIQDKQGRYYQVAFDGYRWRAIDPRQPDAYSKVAVRRSAEGEWIVDSPVLWHDGLPDLTALLEHCQLPATPDGVPLEGASELYESDGQPYLLAGGHALPVRAHLLADHYHLLIPGQPAATTTAWAILRWRDGQWRIRVRQPGRSSDWLALPAAYAVNVGST